MATKFGHLIGRRLSGKRGFGRDDRGVTVIEFALLALPFFSIVAAILETSVVFLTGQVLDSAVQDMSRLIRTGQAQMTMTTVETFRTRICDRLLGLVDCDKLFIDVQSVDNFTAVAAESPVDVDCDTEACDNGWSRTPVYTTGAGSSIMTVQVYYKWPVVLNFPGLGLANLPNNKRLLGAVAVFRNEPFT